MTATNDLAEITIRLVPEMPPEITAIDDIGISRSWFTHLEDLVTVFRAQHKPVLRCLPANLLATDLESCSVWWRPQGMASMLLSMPEQTVRLHVPLPALVLAIGKSGSQAVMALKGDGRPELDTPLYYPPLPNIDARGAVCLGSTVLGRFDPLLETEPWNVFWGSAFSGHQVAGKSVRFPDDVRLLLLELEGKDAFPVEDLQPAGFGFGDWLSSMTRLERL